MRSGDMTQGNILRKLILFAIPLLFGNLLQQLYNAFDAIVVGNYVSNEALAAVGSSGPLTNMIIAFFMGLSAGASVLISQFYGARDQKSLSGTVHTAMLMSLILGVVLSAVGIIFTPALLRWMDTPETVFQEAVQYLQIYFYGLTALTVYNMGAAVLTAMGDSRRPLYFLTLSAAINVAGNLAFVLIFDMKIAGVAYSTVISEAISAVLVVIVLCRSHSEYRLDLRKLRIDFPLLKRIAMIGMPSGLQQAIISFSNIAVQGYINRLGPIAMSGYTAGTKLDSFTMLPAHTMAMAITTFVGQNLGAHQVERARRGTRYAMIVGMACTALIGIAILLFGRILLRIFTPDPLVIESGYQFMSVFAPTYVILNFTQILPGALRGADDVRVPTLVCIFCFVVLRQIYLFVVTQHFNNIITVALGYPVTWIIAATAILIHYRRSNWDRFLPPSA